MRKEQICFGDYQMSVLGLIFLTQSPLPNQAGQFTTRMGIEVLASSEVDRRDCSKEDILAKDDFTWAYYTSCEVFKDLWTKT
jgi:hypothetical protein